jgi:hypothetical protein
MNYQLKLVSYVNDHILGVKNGKRTGIKLNTVAKDAADQNQKIK